MGEGEKNLRYGDTGKELEGARGRVGEREKNQGLNSEARFL